MNVLIVTEDFRQDQYIALPIIQRMLAAVGKPRANVRVCLDPLMGGVSEAMKWTRIQEVLELYPMVQLFLLLVDRDGKEGRRQALDGLEQKAAEELSNERTLLAENAWQEIEVWALAGQKLPKDWSWQEIRAEVDPKEKYFQPLAEKRNLMSEPGQGRTTMGREAANNYRRVHSRCKEDIQSLESRLKAWLDQL